MNSLCEQFEHSSLRTQLSYNFKNDLDTIIEQIKQTEKKNIIEICLECNDRLSWNYDIYISIIDYNWLISNGRNYFNHNLEGYNIINSNIYNELIELFKLQIE